MTTDPNETDGALTLINVFRVRPGQQQAVIELQIEDNRDFASKQPGFLSAVVHRGLDGGTVAMRSRWRSRADLDAAHRRPEFSRHGDRMKELVESNEMHLYEVVAAFGAEDAG